MIWNGSRCDRNRLNGQPRVQRHPERVRRSG